MRMVLGLDAPTRGSALVGGRLYRELKWPLREVGALLDARAVHPGRTGRNHLKALARAGGVPAGRVGEVLEIVGLSKAADRRAGTYSLGMSQRLGIAAALLGDPGVLLFDEPVNGLDPDGVRWVRTFLRSLAAEGRTVLLSSHLMSEMQMTADHLVVIGRGRLLADTTVAEFVSEGRGVRVTSPDAAGLAALGERLPGARSSAPGTLYVAGESVERVGDLAYQLGVRLHGLTVEEASLEQKYMELTGESVEYGVGA